MIERHVQSRRGNSQGAGGDPDLPLVRAAQADAEAFDPLYRRYVAPLYSYAFYHVRDHHDAEDITERAFLSALDALPAFEERGATFRAWLFRIAHNALMNHVRTRSRRRTEQLDTAVAYQSPDDVEATVARREDARRVWRAVGALPEERRRVVILRFVDELSSREIGDVLGRSEGAVRVLLHRALREIARELADREPASA